jgi:ABC-type antimicrobial peptide transport system permease subunit
VALVGIAIGLAGAAALSHYLEGMLFGITPANAGTYIAAALLFVGAAAIAALVPARRATNVDPLLALRVE